MPRRPDVPCAGCGVLIWRGKGCLPPGQATCLACRRAGRGPHGHGRAERTCPVDGKVFRPSGGSGQVCCSRRCAFLHAPHRDRAGWRGGEPIVAPCEDCGTAAPSSGWPHRCRPCAEVRRRASKRRHDSIRRGAKPPRSRSYALTIVELGTRDGWRCHLCRRHVYRHLQWPHPGCATFDHLIPVVEHGDEEPENLALAHLRCNSRRGAGGTVQLALVG